jgi:hypothetical protein
MTRHLQACEARKAAMQAPLVKEGSRARPRTTKIFHIKVQATYLPEYWLHLEVPGDERLQTLDQFLRDIWLECCGHLSQFIIEDVYYQSGPYYDDDRSMNVAVQRALKPGMHFEHEYDFGSTTYLSLEVIGERTGKAQGLAIGIMARNDPLPEWVCDVCGQPATQFCAECIDYGEQGVFCDAHAEEHECGEEMMRPVVNSPRMGVCGYTG